MLQCAFDLGNRSFIGYDAGHFYCLVPFIKRITLSRQILQLVSKHNLSVGSVGSVDCE